MARHHIWEPGPDDPPLLEWFAPLVELGRRARAERIHWPMLVEDFELVRRVDRQRRHGCGPTATAGTGGELHVDDAGATYDYRPHPSAGAGGRFVATPLRRAVYAAELHRQPEDLWYEFPGERRRSRRPTQVPTSRRCPRSTTTTGPVRTRPAAAATSCSSRAQETRDRQPGRGY